MSALYLDPSQPIEARVGDLMGRLTVDEKIGLMNHVSSAVERLGIPEYDWWNECLHGVGRAGRATVFPQAIGLAATFDEDLVHRVADAISDEARAKHHAAVRAGNRGAYRGLTFWSPNVNIFRDPRWGRGQETYGEDPVLTGRIGAAFVRGLQGDDPDHLKVAACAKHYAVHSGPEGERHRFDAQVSKRDLFDTYLPAFESLVEAGVESVMGAYNRTLGEPCCASELLMNDILRGRWGFRGHYVSDCWAIQDFHQHHKITADAAESAALAVRLGCDLSCGCAYKELPEALSRGIVSEAEIDRCVERLLRTRFRLGMFDGAEHDAYASIPVEVIGCEAHRDLAREAAEKSVVLLKNDGVLPLGTCKRIFVTGPSAASVDVLLGNYFGVNSTLVTILEGIAGRVDQGTTVQYRLGCLVSHPGTSGSGWMVGEAREADVAIVCLGLAPQLEGEEGEAISAESSGDRIDIGLPEVQMEYLRALKASGTPIVLVVTGGAAIAMPEAHELADAMLFVWYPGERGGEAVARVLFGDACPSGRLPVTFPMSVDQLPPFEDYSMANRTYRYSQETPLYPFGFGLSYARFSYSEPLLMEQEDGLVVSALVRNEGDREAEEVVQLYLHDLEASVSVPRWALKEFERIRLAPGASERVAFAITPRMLELVDEEGERRMEPGRFRALIGGACPHPRAQELGAPAPAVVEFEVV